MFTKINYAPFITIIYIEIALIFLVVLVTYALFFFYKYKHNNQEISVKSIERYLLSDGVVHKPKQTWHNLYCILSAIQTLKKEHKFKENARSKQVMQQLMLPAARKQAFRYFWYFRYLAAKAFTYCVTVEDESIILHLLQDDHPSVTLEASRVIYELPTQTLINTLIDRVAFYDRKNYEFYIEIFKRMPLSTRAFLINRLGYERRLAERALCYKILLCYPADEIYPNAYKDVTSPQLELAVAAIRYIFYVEKAVSSEFIQNLLQDPRVDVKIFTLAEIVRRQWANMIDRVALLLDDSNAVVRFSAAKTLRLLGDPGIRKLKQIRANPISLGRDEIDQVLSNDKAESGES